MPAIGAEVADAYIEVHADTGPFRRELKREATLAAREASDDFGVEFTKAIDKDLDPLGVKVARQLRKAGELGGANLIEGIADEVRARADRINKAFVQSITFGDFSPFIESFENFDDAIEDFTQRLRALNKDGTLTEKTFKRLDAAFNAYVKTIQDDAIEQALNDQRKASVAALEAEEKRVARQTQINNLFTRDFQKNVEKITAAQTKLSNALVEVDRESPTFKVVTKDLKRLEVGLDKAKRQAERFNIGLGSLKGSRNDFLNFIGSLSGFLERNIGLGLRRTFEGIGGGVSFLGKSLAGVNGPLGSVGRKLDGFGNTINKLGAGGLDGLIIQIAALSLGFQALIAIIGPIAAGVSGLAAAFIALTVGIGGGLLGGIVALGPALSALAVGAGAVAIAFTDLSKRQKAVFGPLKELFEDVRDAIQSKLFSGIGDQVKDLVSALTPLGPFLSQLAGVFRNWVNTIVGEIGPKGPLAATFESLGNTLPGIFRTLLDLISATGGALTGLFAGAAPGAERLFRGITGVVEQFSAWVNTSEGQQAINGFMQTAVDILNDLWEIATAVGNTLRIMWSGGAAEAAQALLQGISGIVERMNAWLEKRAGQEALLAFFRNGVSVAEGLGRVVVALVGLFNALDTTFTRIAFSQIISFLTTAIGWITRLAVVTEVTVQQLVGFVAQAIRVANSLGNLGARAAEAGSAFRTTLINAFNKVMAAITTFLTRGRAHMFTFNAIVRDVAAKVVVALVNIIRRFTAVGGSIITLVNRTRANMASFISAVLGAVARVGAGLRTLVTLAGRAAGAFANVIRRGATNGLQAIGTFAIRAVATLSALGGRFASIGASIMQGLLNGIARAAGGVLSYIRGLASDVASAFASVLGIFSPSRVFRELGQSIADGLVLGMEEGTRSINRAVTGLVDPGVLGNVNAPISSLAAGQGASGGTGGAVGGIAQGAITIVTPYANPRLVAIEALDALAAQGK